MTSDELRDLFTLHEGMASHLFEKIQQRAPDSGNAEEEEEGGSPAEMLRLFESDGADAPLHSQEGRVGG